MPVTTKTKGHNGYVTARFTASGFVNLHSANPTLGANAAGETVTSMNIVAVNWATSESAPITIKRGANTVLVLAGQDNWNLQQDNMIIDTLGGEASSNLQVTITGNSSIIIKLHKHSKQAGID